MADLRHMLLDHFVCGGQQRFREGPLRFYTQINLKLIPGVTGHPEICQLGIGGVQ